MELGSLRWYSNHLRQLAVDVLEQQPKRVLYLQGDELMTTEELLEAVAEHNNIKPEVCVSPLQLSSGKFAHLSCFFLACA